MLRVKLKVLDAWNDRRKAIAAEYFRKFNIPVTESAPADTASRERSRKAIQINSRHCEEALADAACRELSRTAIQTRPLQPEQPRHSDYAPVPRLDPAGLLRYTRNDGENAQPQSCEGPAGQPSNRGIILPFVPDYAAPVWHLFVIRTPQREALQTALTSAGIGSMIHYPIPPHRQAASATLGYSKGDFPLAEVMAKQVLSLPIGPHLTMTEAQAVIPPVMDTR